MIDTRNPARSTKTFSRTYIAPTLQAWLDEGGTVEGWLNGRAPLISYARISADRLNGDAIGVGRQHKNNSRNAELHGCAVVLHYEDNNVTAAKREVVRPAFLQMCRDITHGQEEETGIPVRGCVAVEQERVYRLPRDFIAFQDALVMVGDGIFIEGKSCMDLVNDHGTTIAGLVTSGTGDAEVKKMRKRTVRNAADRAEEGKVYGGPRRFGWLGASRDPFRLGNKYKDKAEWDYLILMIRARYAGRSWRGITGDMNKTGVTTARGGRWTEQAVKGLVTNPAWWGGRILDGELVTDSNTGEPVIGEWDHAKKEDGVTYEMWQSIMTGVNANRLHRGMQRGEAETQPTGEFRTRAYLFSGVLRCGRINDLGETCYAKLTGNKATGKNAKYGDYYRCGDANCRGIGRRVVPVDEFLEGLTLAYLDKHFSGTKVKTIPWRGKEKLAGLRKQRRDIKESVACGEADWSDVHDLLTRLSRNIKTLEQEEKDHLKAEAKRNLLRGWNRRKWGGMELEEKREIIAHILTSVVVLPIPEGVSDKAPFDPTLLKVLWRKDSPATKSKGERGAKTPDQDQAVQTRPLHPVSSCAVVTAPPRSHEGR
ncbi:recombinase family protein [Streptomyces inhibens]|uniref:recombinase family protein n=1 Tax=Streptomyces inhibens TaxID=2293571 RepID=UPI001EE6A79C|nr:recombinase family protein [Streptomyces inhibens]UKY52047.1 recombinase family protein [Streptomyces inhibens]